ncbi:hypothetical protein AB0F72_22865 [Actinoplanes sp. NPDC023936]|uniref:hypothetical protein n=1 Tax=Actinoplanes sp. NPDC023936 TaxID=3154910 RepID=UPI0033DF0BC4
MPVVSSKARRRAGALLVASAAVLFTAACGGGSDDSSTATDSSAQGGGGNSAFAAYVSCLNANGVTITMPSGGPGGGNGGTRPSGAPGGVRPSGAPGGNAGALPSGQPRPSGSAGQRGGFPGGGMFQQPAGVDDATWEKAQTACASVRPSMGAGRGNGGSNAGGGADAAYTNCLTENGVTDTANLDESDATTKKAVETCSVLKPSAAATS